MTEQSRSASKLTTPQPARASASNTQTRMMCATQLPARGARHLARAAAAGAPPPPAAAAAAVPRAPLGRTGLLVPRICFGAASKRA